MTVPEKTVHSLQISDVEILVYRNLAIFRVENISYVIISHSFNFVRSPYHMRNTCENFVVEKYSYV